MAPSLVAPAFGYLDVRPFGQRFATDYPTGNRWQRRSVMAFTLFWRLVPLAALGVLPAMVSNSTGTGALAQGACAPGLAAFVVGFVLGLPGGFERGGPSFFPQAVLPLALKYALRRDAR